MKLSKDTHAKLTKMLIDRYEAATEAEKEDTNFKLFLPLFIPTKSNKEAVEILGADLFIVARAYSEEMKEKTDPSHLLVYALCYAHDLICKPISEKEYLDFLNQRS